MAKISLIFTKHEFLDTIRSDCSNREWPNPPHDISLEFNQNKHLQEAHVKFIIHNTMLSVQRYHIIIDGDWFKSLVKDKYPNHILPNKFYIEKIGTDREFDLCITFDKFILSEFIRDCFKRIF